jgi:ribonuclease P protein component
MIKFRSLFSFTKKEIDKAFQQARPAKRAFGLTLLTAPASHDATHGKLLVITPRSSGKAHQRNRFRRRAKEVFYTEKLYQKPTTWILLVRKQAIDFDFAEISNFLKEAIEKDAK